MEFSNFKNKKFITIGAATILLIFLIYLLIFKPFGKVDDWQYSYTTPENYIILAAVVAGLLLLSWLIISIYLIASGKPLIDNNLKRTNPRRIIGLISLIGPFVLVTLAAALMFIAPAALLIIPLLILTYLIFGIIYSVRKHVKLAILPISVIAVIILGTILVGGLLSVRSMSSVGGGMFDGAGVQKLGSTNMAYSMAESDNLGFSVGGAKDINNFRENINNNYLPLYTDITYEGLYYDYYFDTGEQKPCTNLFCPSYSSAISKDPFSEQDEYYLSVGLNSNIKESDFERKKLNLVVVLDISGSMSSSFSQYYYDSSGQRKMIEGADNDSDYQKSKMEVATKSIVLMLDHLNPDDRFGMVLYDGDAYLGKHMSTVSETDMESIKRHILELEPRGSTNFEAGYTKGTTLFDDYLDADQNEYENRIIFLTDAMPNTGDISEEGLFGLTKKNSENKIYTTFIGIGVDFNTELIEHITKIRGANYYSVHSSSEFKNRMDNEFEYMVTPLVFNLTLTIDAPGYQIERVYGSPEADEATGEIMRVNTLFPSKQEKGETRGGLVLLKLKKVSDNKDIKIKVSYENRLGQIDSSEESFTFDQKTSNTYDNTGIRKGILLARYANLMKNWINDERASASTTQQITPAVNKVNGIVLPPDYKPAELGRWERQSVPLKVSAEYQALFSEFKPYFEREMKAIGDNTLSKETLILTKLETYNNSTGTVNKY
ncbi:MAG: VWA domain-containing protein [Candidatus Nanoarchaeia archaeon]